MGTVEDSSQIPVGLAGETGRMQISELEKGLPQAEHLQEQRPEGGAGRGQEGSRSCWIGEGT